MSTEAVYSQAPLATERREIRILILAPGTGDDVLRGELIVESLDYDDLHYTALSYTWSGSVGEHNISIGGAPLYITENLSMALRRIRGPTRPRNMWVDAICINQGDFEEKAVQVSMMGDIFASATRTIVWLGEKSADSDVAMDFMASLQQVTLDQPDDDSKMESTCWRAVDELMQRTWWTRIWVVQEALMSRRVIVQCGEKRVDILNFVKILGESRVGKNSDQPSSPFESPFNEILSNWYVHKNQVEASGLSLQSLIFSTRGFQATIWRDRIFALLGLATAEARSYVTPDYSDEVPDRLILIRLTMYFLRESVQPLQYASVCRAINCPSWVPDWTAINVNLERLAKPRHQGSDRLFPFKAAEDYPHFEPPVESLPRYQEPLTLLVHGFVIDRVQAADQIPDLDCVASDDFVARVKSIKTHVRVWELRLMELIELAWSRAGQRKRLIEDRFVEIKELLIYDLCTSNATEGSWLLSLPEFCFPAVEFHEFCLSWEPDPRDLANYRDIISDYEEWMQCFPSSEQAEQQSQDICKLCEHTCKPAEDVTCAHCAMGQKICRNSAGRTMSVTDNAHILTDSLAVQEGDIICLLLSSTSLFVLRKADEIHWTLVGTLATTHEFDGSDVWRVTRFQEPTSRGQLTTFRLR